MISLRLLNNTNTQLELIILNGLRSFFQSNLDANCSELLDRADENLQRIKAKKKSKPSNYRHLRVKYKLNLEKRDRKL